MKTFEEMYPNIDKWLEKTEGSYHEDDPRYPGYGQETEYVRDKKYWEPHVFIDKDTGKKEIEWLWDHVGDAYNDALPMWEEILRLRRLVED